MGCKQCFSDSRLLPEMVKMIIQNIKEEDFFVILSQACFLDKKLQRLLDSLDEEE